jgi:hypothetical protein
MACGATAFSSTFGRVISHVGYLPESVAVLSDPATAVEFIPPLSQVLLSDALPYAIIDAYAGSLRTI